MAEGAIKGNPVTGNPGRHPQPRGLFRALRRSERGTALVEFALIAPVLFLLLFGIIDFGRALNYYNQVTQLAGQGARGAAVDRNPDGTPISGTSLQCWLINHTGQPELQKGESVAFVSPLPANVGDPVTIKVTYQFKFLPLIGVAAKALNNGLTLTSTQTERAEVVPASPYSTTPVTQGDC